MIIKCWVDGGIRPIDVIGDGREPYPHILGTAILWYRPEGRLYPDQVWLEKGVITTRP